MFEVERSLDLDAKESISARKAVENEEGKFFGNLSKIFRVFREKTPAKISGERSVDLRTSIDVEGYGPTEGILTGGFSRTIPSTILTGNDRSHRRRSRESITRSRSSGAPFRPGRL